MDDKLTAEILATCDSIGYADEDKYYKDPSCLECVKDLVLYLRRDDDDHSVRRLLGRAQVVQRDLLPLLKHYSDDLELYDVVLRLLVNLTHPALLLYDEQVPKNKKYLSQYLEIENYLRAYKAGFVDQRLWERLTDRLKHLVNLEWDKQMEDDKVALERILVLIRNILMVAADLNQEKRTDDENSLHDRVLMVMHLSGIKDLILFIASSESSREYCLHILEIISLMLREHAGEQIATTQLVRNEDDIVKDERELIKIREKESALRNIQIQKFSTRHSRFGGTFTVKDMKAPSGLDLLCHKPITSTADLSLDANKKTKRTASNRMPLKESDPTRRSTVPVRIILKEFCSQFLEKAYNSIMQVVKDNIVRGRMQDHDETYYLWAMKFFMEFNRFNQFKVRFVSETMSTNTFHYVQTLLDNYHSMMVTDKEKIPYWSKRAHMALKAYQELLLTLLWMDKYGSETAGESSRVIKSNVFYLPEYRELCYSLLNTYDPVKLSKLYLKDLVETNHVFLKMLEEYSSTSRRILVKSKGKKRKKNKKSKKAKKPRKDVPKTDDELEELWATLCQEILLAVESGDAADESENVIPFDATSDVPIEEQSVTAAERIAVFLHTKKNNEAVALHRAAREVWPDLKEKFGEDGLEFLDEALVLKSIFMDKDMLGAVNTALRELDEQEQQAQDEENEENELEEDDEEEEEVRVSSKEQEFDFFGFVLKYAAPKIVCNYAKLFQDWETLKPFTLQCILKMFHRFAFQMDYPALICQASIFRTFQKILQVADYQSDLKEAKKFFYHFWPKFVTLCEKNKSMFVELLFWKTSREAQEIQDGYGSSSTTTQKIKADRATWSKDEENELELLAEEYNGLPDEAKRATKMLAWIKGRWTWRPRSKKMMINKLVEKGLMSAPPKRAKRAPKFRQNMENSPVTELSPSRLSVDSDDDEEEESINDKTNNMSDIENSPVKEVNSSRLSADSDDEEEESINDKTSKISYIENFSVKEVNYSRILVDSDDDEESANDKTSNMSIENSSVKEVNYSRILVDSDDDDEESANDKTSNMSIENSPVKELNSSRVLVDSDDDEENVVTFKPKPRVSRIIESDDED